MSIMDFRPDAAGRADANRRARPGFDIIFHQMRLQHIHARIAVFAAGLVSMLWGFQAMLLSHAPSAFRAPEEDMSFAWYVPLFSIYVLWTERAKIAKSLGAPSWVGFAAMLPFLALGFLGTRGVQLRFEIVAFSGLAVCWMWTVFGRRAAALTTAT